MQTNPTINLRGLTKTNWSRQGLLYLPRYRRIKPAEMDYFATYVSFEEIFGEKFSRSNLENTLARLSVEDCVIALSKIATILDTDGVFNQELQVKLVKDIFGGSKLSEYLLKRLQEKGKFVFFEQQILNLTKFALLHAKPTPVDNFEEKKVFHLFLKCLIGITDLIEADNIIKQKEATSFKEREEIMTQFIIRNLYFNSRDSFTKMIGRYYNLWIKIPKTDQARNSSHYIDLDVIFREATGFSLEEYFSLGFGLVSKYMLMSYLKGTLKTDDYAVNEETYFNKTKIDKSKTILFIRRLSATPNEFKNNLREELQRTGELFYYSFVDIKRNPLVQIGKKHHVPIGLRFLREKITSGIYWTMRNYIYDRYGDKEKKEFNAFLGQVFEIYIQNLLRRIYPPSTVLAKRLFPEQSYTSNGQKKKTVDAFILYEQELILLQIRSSRLMIDTTIFGDINKFSQDVGNIIIGNIKTIDRCIRDFQNGSLPLDGVNPQNIRRYYPVIVTLEPIPLFPSVIRLIGEIIDKEGYLKQSNVAKFEIIDAEEMEMLESLSDEGTSLLEVIKRKATSRIPDLPMKNFLLREEFKEHSFDDNFLTSEYNEIADITQDLLFGGANHTET